MRFRNILLIFALNIIAHNTQAQSGLANPLDGKLLLSANYGELRSSHFHSGIDLKVGGKEGAKVYAVADAYVYRISVSPRGYGNCLYLKHDDGHFTVYGHLQKFNSTLAKFVKTEQYRRKSFSLDTTFSEPLFRVKRGEIIGFAGNSGTSFGAHLHFEIRDAQNIPINPVPKFYSVADKTPPTIKSFTVFGFHTLNGVRLPRIVKDVQLKNVKGKHSVSEIIEIQSPAFFGIEAFDNVDETYNKIGVRRIIATLDNVTFFSCYIDSIEFDKTHYINSLQAYDLLLGENRNVIKTYVEERNNLNKYSGTVNSGIIEISDTLTHSVSIILEDDYKNKSVLNFKIKARKNQVEENTADYKNAKAIVANTGDTMICSGACLIVNPETFYSKTLIDFEKCDTVASNFSAAYSVNLMNTPLRKPLDLVVRAIIPDSLRSKVMLGVIAGERFFAVNAQYFFGFVSAKISSSARYFVVVDTVSPAITPKFDNNADLRKQTSLKIKIADNLSGIKKYDGYIDGEWALFEYDAKNRLLTYTFDSERIGKNKKHTLKLIVSDNKNNTTVFESGFLW